MAWPKPQYSKGEINKSGRILVDTSDEKLLGTEKAPTVGDILWAHQVMSNWRACHGYPINTFQMTLRDKLHRMGHEAVVAQRLKRATSIILKLQRFDNMNLARMQDIGGVRAVLPTVANVRELVENYKKTKFLHQLVSEKDYIATPKSDGYRSVHLVFKYQKAGVTDYNGLSVELQIRTRACY